MVLGRVSFLGLDTDIGKVTEHRAESLVARPRYLGMVIKSSLCI
jgi:hypothetical protein